MLGIRWHQQTCRQQRSAQHQSLRWQQQSPFAQLDKYCCRALMGSQGITGQALSCHTGGAEASQKRYLSGASAIKNKDRHSHEHANGCKLWGSSVGQMFTQSSTILTNNFECMHTYLCWIWGARYSRLSNLFRILYNCMKSTQNSTAAEQHELKSQKELTAQTQFP